MFALEKQVKNKKEQGEKVFCYLSFWKHSMYIPSVYCK